MSASNVLKKLGILPWLVPTRAGGLLLARAPLSLQIDHLAADQPSCARGDGQLPGDLNDS